MGRKTKIDWCDATWNPVTGCLHGCEYCYARKIAHRFDGGFLELSLWAVITAMNQFADIRKMATKATIITERGETI